MRTRLIAFSLFIAYMLPATPAGAYQPSRLPAGARAASIVQQTSPHARPTRISRPSKRTIRRRAELQRAATMQDARRPLRQSTRRNLETEKDRVLQLVNAEREKEGLPTLIRNDYLDRAAQDYAQRMHDEGFFAHESPDGGTFLDRVRATGYPGPCPVPGCSARVNLGENLAKGFITPESVVEGWMGSPGHRKNILSPDYEQIGLGIVGDIWSQEFGKSRYLNP